jgi:AcrR family transcriptional regulator
MAETQRKAGRPTAAQTEKLNEAVVRAALTVFTRVGYAEATMEMIAQESGTTRRSVSHRFPNKGDLFLAVIELAASDQRRRILTPASALAGPPLEALRHVCWMTFDNACADDLVAFNRLVMAETPHNRVAGEVLIRLNDRFAHELESLILRAQRDGAFAGEDPAAVSTALIGIFVSNPLNRRSLGDPQFADEKRRRRYFDEMWALAVRTIARPSAPTRRSQPESDPS